MLTNFHKWYDRLKEPYRLLLALLIASPLIAGFNALPHIHTRFGFVICGVGVLYTLFIFVTRVIYIHSGSK